MNDILNSNSFQDCDTLYNSNEEPNASSIESTLVPKALIDTVEITPEKIISTHSSDSNISSQLKRRGKNEDDSDHGCSVESFIPIPKDHIPFQTFQCFRYQDIDFNEPLDSRHYLKLKPRWSQESPLTHNKKVTYPTTIMLPIL